MGNIILQWSSSKLVLKARELAKAYIWFSEHRERNWLPFLFTVCVWRRSSTLLFQHFVRSPVLTWWLGGGVSCSVNIRESTTSGDGRGRYFEVGRIECCEQEQRSASFPATSTPPLSLNSLFIWCQQYFSIDIQNTWVLLKLQKVSERKNLEHSSTEHLENQEHCLPKRKRKQRLHKGTNARSKGDPCGVAPPVGMLPSLPYLLTVFPLWWTLAFWTLQGRRERQSLVGMWLCAGEGVGWDGFSSWKQ